MNDILPASNLQWLSLSNKLAQIPHPNNQVFFIHNLSQPNQVKIEQGWPTTCLKLLAAGPALSKIPTFYFPAPQKIHITCFTKTLLVPLANRISFLCESPQYVSYGTCHILLLIICIVFTFYPPINTVSSLGRGIVSPYITPHSIVYKVGISFKHKYIHLVFGPSEFLAVRRKLLMENS